MSRAARRRAAAQRVESAGVAGDVAGSDATALPATASGAPSAPVWWRFEQAWLVFGQMLVWGAILVVWLGRGGSRVVDLPADGHAPAASAIAAPTSAGTSGAAVPTATASGTAAPNASAFSETTSDPAWPRLLIDPNTASAVELGLLPGIGPKMAERIMAERARRGRFENAEQLLDVRGIGDKTLARMRPYLHFPPAAPAAGK